MYLKIKLVLFETYWVNNMSKPNKSKIANINMCFGRVFESEILRIQEDAVLVVLN